MATPLSDFINVLKDSYSAYYTIHDSLGDEMPDLPLVFRADYASREERYWLTKSVKYWGNERNEYAYVFAAETFTPELAERCMEWAWQDGIPRVKPHGEHQCTNVKVIFIADTVAPETAKAIHKKHLTKNYRHGLHGYSNLMTGITDLRTKKTVTNSEGHDLVPYFKKLFAAQAQKTLPGSI